MDNSYKELLKELKSYNYSEVSPKKYAEDLKVKFKNNNELWYKSITPKVRAEELKKDTGNDYSEIWHVHCDCCFKSIDKDTKELCYVSEDELTWLCNECYNSLFRQKG